MPGYGKKKSALLGIGGTNGEDLLREASVRTTDDDGFSSWPEATDFGPTPSGDEVDGPSPQGVSVTALSDPSPPTPGDLEVSPETLGSLEISPLPLGEEEEEAVEKTLGLDLDGDAEMGGEGCVAEGGGGNNVDDQTDEGIRELVHDYLDELGADILSFTIKEILKKMADATGLDLADWKHEAKSLIKARAATVVGTSTNAVTPEKEDATAANVGEESDAEVVPEAASEYEDSDDEDDGGEQKKAKSKNGRTSAAVSKAKNRVIEEELEVGRRLDGST